MWIAEITIGGYVDRGDHDRRLCGLRRWAGRCIEEDASLSLQGIKSG
jgi:hypothetical protein